jgi:hypothetical protein
MLTGTIGLMYDYPNGRPDTLSLYRKGREVQAFDFDTRWLPDAFLGPMSDLMDAIARGRQPVTAGRQMLPTLAIGERRPPMSNRRAPVRITADVDDRRHPPGAIFSTLHRAFACRNGAIFSSRPRSTRLQPRRRWLAHGTW